MSDGCRKCGLLETWDWYPRVDGNDVMTGYECAPCGAFVTLDGEPKEDVDDDG